MSSPLRPGRPQASQPSPTLDAEISSDDSTLAGDDHLYSHTELGLLRVELCGPGSSVIVEISPSTTMTELGAIWRHLKKVEYDLRISAPFATVGPDHTLADIVMARRVDFEPWDASSDVVLSIAPVNHTSAQDATRGADTPSDKIRVVIRSADGNSVGCTVTGRARLSRIAEGYAKQVSNGEDDTTYRFIYAGRLLDSSSRIADIAPLGMDQFELLAVVESGTTFGPGVASP